VRTVRRVVVPPGASRSYLYAARTAVLFSAATFACTDTGEQASSKGDETSMTVIDSPDGSGPGHSDASNTGGSGSGTTGPDNAGPGNTGELDGPSNTPGPNGPDNPSGPAGSSSSNPDGGSGGMNNQDDGGGPGPSPTTPSEMNNGGMACPGYMELTNPALACASAAECAMGTVCSTQPVFTTSRGSGAFAPPLCNDVVEPCSEATCDGICEASLDGCGDICVPLCTEETCTGTAYCVDNTCIPRPCDMDGAAPCGDGFLCAPGEANANALGCLALDCDEPGALACSNQFQCAPGDPDADYRGCTRLLCDDPGGPDCSDGYACRPDGERANVYGCEPLGCDEAGGPVCAEGSVCRPDSMWANQFNPGYIGCAPVMCDEPGGPECPQTTRCVSGSTTSATGCELILCDEGSTCDPWRDCDVAAIGSGADNYGCIDRACSDDGDCACGFCTNGTCTPEQAVCRTPEIIATPYGCVWPDDEFV